jgi:hypothetical protein
MTTLQSHINSTAGISAADLSPLVANDTYRSAVDRELALREAATVAAAAALAREDELLSATQPFATAMGAIRAIAKRFPETAKFMDEAAKAVQAAMGVVAYNPQPIAEAKPATPPSHTPAPGNEPWRRKWQAPTPAPTPTPAPNARPFPATGPVVDATGATPTFNRPKP